ncbi:MAG TPA: hypothetical protein VJ378_00645 [Candidatus Paceibacterota bacterium]|nr:hypothetical protein [Candidatus Paceibacterota bacterium]
MSIWNIKLRQRRVTITIAKILQKWGETEGRFLGMKILDTKGKEHIVDFTDLICNLKTWNKLKEGDKIVHPVREQLTHQGRIVLKRRPEKIKQAEIPKPPYYRWICLVCKKTNTVSYEGFEELSIIGNSIVVDHDKKNKDCKERSFRVWDHLGQERTEEFNQFMGF